MATSQQQDYFPVGSVVQCVTCLGEQIEGEVLAFDHPTKLLALKVNRLHGQSKKTRLQTELINMNLVKDARVIRESSPVAASNANLVPNCNFHYPKINMRADEEANKKRRSVCPDTVTPEGRRLFVAIRKTIEDICWDGENILVMSVVSVVPPYKSENIHIREGQQQENAQAQAQRTADHLKKIVEQFWMKYQSDGLSSSVSSGKSKSLSMETLEGTPS